MNGKEIKKKLKALEWEIKSINGSHHQMIKDGVKVTVPVHGTQDVKIKTLLSIEKQSGVILK
ncbi:MAG: type II toxin-antitoxin system HicA family toxin [Deltaproteobacteria bacterium]|nr:type II toxin-antitoxin system HicA family toxin [Deltaproteobacteria bacterium]